MFNKTKAPLTRAQALQEYAGARSNLLLMLILTLVNVVLYFAGTGTMMLFSASVPYFSVIFGHAFTMETGSDIFLYAGIAVAAVVLIAYLFCWIFSKSNYGWMVFALVLFIVDTLVMGAMYLFVLEDVSGVLDVIVHLWVLAYLILGARRGAQLKTLPEDEPVPAEPTEVQ